MATTKTHTDVLERRAKAQEIEEEERDHRCCESHRDHRSICDIKSKEIQPHILGFIYYFTGVTVTVTWKVLEQLKIGMMYNDVIGDVIVLGL